MYLLGLLVLAIVGFWDSYFSQLLDFEKDFNFYFHFHASTAMLWILILIAQPLLIRKKKLHLHRRVGKMAAVLMLLFFISVILLTHYQQVDSKAPHYIGVYIPFKDLFLLVIFYGIAMYYRKVVFIHARAMIATGIIFIEPALIRAVRSLFPSLESPYMWTIGMIYSILILLIFFGRRYSRGWWIFPLLLCMYIVIHSIVVFRLPMGAFDSFANWFLSLPLT